ncbi:MAG: DASH family cryptochrome [Oscillatoriales cyanobacterium SM2_1_8]|nr:DASH family cryptochrome [Oscillatoriales cyanobacterium SM2_1_8]
MERVLVWFRNDLRVHDHGPLTAAVGQGIAIPVYCLDPRQWGTTAFGWPRLGPYRAVFWQESLADLRSRLQGLGADLVLRVGTPETVLPALVQELGAQRVVAYHEIGTEESRIERAVAAALPCAIEWFWGRTLLHPDDLPMDVSRLPEVFTSFRKEVEAAWTVRSPLPAPTRLPGWETVTVDAGPLPTLATWGITPPGVDERRIYPFVGGETAGLARLQEYFWERDRLRVYKETRNGMVNADDSSKLSPWLAMGCVSPRQVWQEVQRYETERVANDSTYWLIFELLWRDYFAFIAWKHGAKIFRRSGLLGIDLPWGQNAGWFQRWCDGETGYPLVDANMKELQATGFMSNRGRQNVASFLTKNLNIDWRLGAAWLESWLIDYDPCSNYGNWIYAAGVGNDARGFRFFNILKQSQDYDPDGTYVKRWLPQLAALPPHKVHTPWQLLPVERQRWLAPGDYPPPIVDLWESARQNEGLYQKAVGATPPKYRRSRRG